MKNNTLIVHPGTQHAFKLAVQLYKNKLLYRFVTGIALPRGLRHVEKLLPRSLKKKLGNRILRDVPFGKVIIKPSHELKAFSALRKGLPATETYNERNKQFQLAISNRLLNEADVIIGFDTSSWILARRSAQHQKKFILDVTTPHSSSKEKILRAVIAGYPEWSFNIEQKSNALLIQENEEYKLADLIVVASTFSKRTLIENGVDERKIIINPYGVDLDRFVPKKDRNDNRSELSLLFVGTIDAKKGIPFLLNVWRKFQHKNIRLGLVGGIDAKVEQLIRSLNFPNVDIIGKVSNVMLPEIYAKYDVFVFPSFFEGFGLVILEAMASGLPVITTTVTGGTDAIENGKQGFVIEPGNSRQLEDAIQYFVDNGDAIGRMGVQARKKAEHFTWDAYGQRWAAAINQLTEGNG